VKSEKSKIVDQLLCLVRNYAKGHNLEVEFATEALSLLATQHQIQLVAHAIVPTLFADFMRESAMAYLSVLRQLFVITEAFEAGQIPYFLHKGFHYSSFYKQMTHRQVGDIDIVVLADDLPKVQNLLMGLGYVRWQSPKADFSIGGDYHWQFIPTNTTVGISWVEVHWSHSAAWEQIKFPIESVFTNLQKTSINGQMVAVPSPDDLVLLLTVHHGAKERWRKLKYLLDLTLIVKRYDSNLNWRSIYAKANDAHLTNYLSLGLLLAQRHIGINIPIWLVDELNKNKVIGKLATEYIKIWSNVESTDFGTVRNLLFALRIQSNWRLRLVIIKDLLWTIIRDYWKNTDCWTK
jgi:Uncharacterised nucleotidyltransferase